MHDKETHISIKYKLSDYPVILTFIVLAILGIAVLPILNLSLKPNSTLTEISINYFWPNASAKAIESEVTMKLERLLNSIGQLTEITSESKKGSGYINLKFTKDKPLEIAKFEVASIIRRAYADFPKDVSYPFITLGNSENNTPLLTYTISAASNTNEIAKNIKEQLEPKIARIKGVKSIELYGETPWEFVVEYNPEKLVTYNISTEDIIKSLNNYFGDTPLGFTQVNAENQHQLRVILQSYQNNLSWQNIPIKIHGGRIIHLNDIAHIKFQEEKPQSYYRINGLNNINLLIYPVKGNNEIKLAKTIKSEISILTEEFPSGYQIELANDESEYIAKEIKKILIRTLASLLILFVFVYAVSRQMSYLFIIFISLLINLLLAFLLFYLFKIDIHLYSLAGLTISFGIIIDNSIIMIEHYRHYKNRKVFISILSATLTTIGALSCVFLLSDKQKLNLVDFAWVVIITLSVSLLVAQLFIPSLLNYWPVKTKVNKRYFNRKRLIINFNRVYFKLLLIFKKFKWAIITIAILGFGLPFHLLPKKIENKTQWGNIYNATLGSNWYQSKIQPVACKLLGGTLRLFTEYVFESYSYSDPKETKLYILGKMPEGCTVHQMNQTIIKIEDFLNQEPGVRKFISTVKSYDYGLIEIYFKDSYSSSYPYVLKSRLTSMAISLGGADWSVYGVGRGFSNAIGNGFKPYRILLEGYNYNMLYGWAEKFCDTLSKNKRITGLEIGSKMNWFDTENKTDFLLDFKNRELATRNFDITTLYDKLSQQLDQSYANPIIYNSTLTNIIIKPDNANNYNKWLLLNQPLLINNKTTKLPEIATLTKKKAGNNIFKKNQIYQLNIAWDFIGPAGLAEKVLNKNIDQFNKQLPLGFKASTQNWFGWDVKNKRQYMLILLTIIIIYFICSILLESFILPLSIISLIPISFIGVFLTFYLFDFGFDQGGFASFILLTGVVVNSAIYIVNEFNFLRNTRKIENSKAYIKAFNHKIIPIFLTIISTMLGMIPFVWLGQDEAFWFSFAVGTMGGLIFSIIALLIFFPLFLKLKSNEKK